MQFWGKILGGAVGSFFGPIGAVVGAAVGHALDSGAVLRPFQSANLAALLGNREQLFSIAVVVLSAKLAKCDGPVKRIEIDAFKRSFRIPPEGVHDVGLLFDQARDSNEGFEDFAQKLGQAFSDNHGVLEDVLGALFAIARADAPINRREQAFLVRVHQLFGLPLGAWDRARDGTPQDTGPDPYTVLGVVRTASDEELRVAWRKLMRENHPDTLAARGVPAEFIKRATDKVAEINAAWNAVKKERGL